MSERSRQIRERLNNDIRKVKETFNRNPEQLEITQEEYEILSADCPFSVKSSVSGPLYGGIPIFIKAIRPEEVGVSTGKSGKDPTLCAVCDNECKEFHHDGRLHRYLRADSIIPKLCSKKCCEKFIEIKRW